MELFYPRNNFNSGRLSKKLSARYDLKTYLSGLLYCKNWVPQVQGGLFFAPGFEYIRPTRGNAVGRFLTFAFNEQQTYSLEFTEGKIRFYDDDGILLEAAKNITGATQALACVIDCGSHGYSNGDEVFITGVKGMTELNGKFYRVDSASTHFFSLKDLDGNYIDSTAFDAYTTGGTTSRVYEIDSPYLEEDLSKIKYAQQGDITYLVDRYHEPQKLTRSGELSWAIAPYTRTADPFTSAISGITKADPGVVTTSVAHGLSTGDIVRIRSVVGMTQVNDLYFAVTVIDTTRFELHDVDTNANINTSGYGTYTSGGVVACVSDQPGAVAFYGGRLFFGGTVRDTDYFWGSRLPTDAGEPRYDDFTTGTDDDHAIAYPIKSISNTFEEIRMFAGTPKFLAIGSLGGMYKATGSTGDGSTITPTSISVVPVDYSGCADIQPIFFGSSVFFVQRGKKKLNSFEYDLFSDSYAANDLNFISDEITGDGIDSLTYTRWYADTAWALREDGVLLGLIYKNREQIAGWFEIEMAGTDARVLSAAGQVREFGYDILYVIVERTINGVTRRYVEKMTTDPVFPEKEDYFTGDEDADELRWRKIMYEAQKRTVRLHSALFYDGLQSCGLTLSAGTGLTTGTADSAIFEASDVGREIEVKAVTGDETGVAVINSYISPTEVMLEVQEDFSALSWAAGTWYLSTNTVTGFDHLEGETIGILGDGGEATDAVVTNGAVTFDGQYTYVVGGLKYKGIAALMPAVPQEIGGYSFTKTKTINRLGFRLRNTLGLQFGTDLYMLNDLEFTTSGDYTRFPPELFSGEVLSSGYDTHALEKVLYLVKEGPQPAEILGIQMFIEPAEV